MREAASPCVMTAALGYLNNLSTERRRSGQLLCIGAVVFAVPTFAAVGLSLPLPVTVERIAANLVPFANASAVESQSTSAPKAHGRIVLAPAERHAVARPTRAHDPAPTRPLPSRAASRHAVAPATPGAPAPRHDPAETAGQNPAAPSPSPSPVAHESAPSTPASPSEAPPSAPVATPAPPPPAPAQTTPAAPAPPAPQPAATTQQPATTNGGGNGNGGSNPNAGGGNPNAGGANAGGNGNGGGSGGNNGQDKGHGGGHSP